MKAPAALDLVASWLAEMRISPTHTRVLLGLLYMVRVRGRVRARAGAGVGVGVRV